MPVLSMLIQAPPPTDNSPALGLGCTTCSPLDQALYSVSFFIFEWVQTVPIFCIF